LIKEQFIKVLSGIYHHRIDYPQTRHLTESPESAAAARTREAPVTDRIAAAAKSTRASR